jgi:hypothetical protein
MRYLITHPDHKPFYVNVFNAEYNWIDGSTVFDLFERRHMVKRYRWEDTDID